MSGLERIRIDPARPHRRRMATAVARIEAGGFLVLPTEATYVFACRPQASGAMEAIRRLRGLDDRHRWSVLCASIAEAARLARIDDAAFRLIRRLAPGPYTFILPASSTLPRRVFGRRREIGVRLSAHPVVQALLEAVGAPLVTTTLIFAGEDAPAVDPDRFGARLRGADAVLLDAGLGGDTPTTVLDLTGGEPVLVRAGLGPWPA